MRALLGLVEGDGVTAEAPVLERYPDFAALIEAGEDEILSERLRRAETVGRPLGSDAFVRAAGAGNRRTFKPARRGTKPKAADDGIKCTVNVIPAGAARGAVVGLVSNTVQQGVDIASGNQKGYSVTSAAVSTAVGAATEGIATKVGTVKVPGITSGRNNMAATARGVQTRIANGNAQNMSARTAVKGAIGGQVGDAGKTAVSGAIDTAKTWACNNLGTGCK